MATRLSVRQGCRPELACFRWKSRRWKGLELLQAIGKGHVWRREYQRRGSGEPMQKRHSVLLSSYGQW